MSYDFQGPQSDAPSRNFLQMNNSGIVDSEVNSRFNNPIDESYSNSKKLRHRQKTLVENMSPSNAKSKVKHLNL